MKIWLEVTQKLPHKQKNDLPPTGNPAELGSAKWFGLFACPAKWFGRLACSIIRNFDGSIFLSFEYICKSAHVACYTKNLHPLDSP